MPRPFNGKINVDVRDSVPDWEPYMPPCAPEGSPNVLIVLHDETGMAAWERPEAAAPNIRGRSFMVLAEVDIDSPDAEGVIFAQGGRFGGHALYLKDRRAHYVYNLLGVPPEQRFSSAELEPGRHVIGRGFAKDHVGEHNEAVGTTRFHVDDAVVAEEPMRTQVGFFTLCGDGLCVGRDSSDAVSSAYSSAGELTGASVLQVEVNLGDDQYIDLEREAFAALARE